MTDDLEWYAARDGRQIRGPFSRDKLGVLLATGELKPSDFIWQEGWSRWSPVAMFLEHAGAQRIAAKFSAPQTSPRHWGAMRIAAIIALFGAFGAALLLTLYQW